MTLALSTNNSGKGREEEETRIGCSEERSEARVGMRGRTGQTKKEEGRTKEREEEEKSE